MKITKNELLNPKEAVTSGKILGSCEDVNQNSDSVSWHRIIRITCRALKKFLPSNPQRSDSVVLFGGYWTPVRFIKAANNNDNGQRGYRTNSLDQKVTKYLHIQKIVSGLDFSLSVCGIELTPQMKHKFPTTCQQGHFKIL